MRKIAGAAHCVFLFTFSFVACAQSPAPPTTTPATTSLAQPHENPVPIAPVPAAPTPSHTLDQADLTAFFDGVLPLQLERSDIAGASVLVMKDGNVLLTKGYGYADFKSKKPVDPDATI